MMNLLKSLFGGTSTAAISDALSRGAVIVDVRSPGEFTAVHADGAINIPLDRLGTEIDTLKRYQKPIILCCASGIRNVPGPKNF
ncbi:rhodanese-like domain-containing protein [Spirosoma sp. KNUC1025]|uniref:rhodanese-like domain-containing protein n=1 Tax=Spirosoma sp. KNUC1025 TaxID=2894082 RepID=UPI0038645D52|nr:rhodanese-like domain-containing protein [Spirosoma sp. KNUC1025]